MNAVDATNALPPQDAAAEAAGTARAPAVLWALMAAGLAVRVAVIFALKAWNSPNAIEHKSLALSLLQGNGFAFGDFNHYGPSSVQSPPYPFLLAGIFAIFGHDTTTSYAVAMLINALLGTLTIYLCWRLAGILGATGGVALLAAAFAAFSPTQVYTVTHVQAIIAITAATTAMSVLFYQGVRTGRVEPWIGFSLVATVAALTEPVLLPAAAITGLIVLVWPGLAPRIRFRNAAILLLAAVVVFGPWVIRNYRVHGRLMPVKSTFWVNVWKGNNPYATGTDRLPLPTERRAYFLREGMLGFSDAKLRDPATDQLRQYDKLTPEQLAELSGLPDAAREDVWKKYAQQWIGENPGKYARMCGVRLFKTLTIDWDNPKSYSVFYVVPKLLLLVASVIGLFMAIRRRWSLFYPGLIVVTSLLTYTLTITASRFSLPLEPIQFCLAALAVVGLYQWLRPGDARERLT